MKELRRTIFLSRLSKVQSILTNSKGKLSKKDRELVNRFMLTLPTHIFRFVVQQIRLIEKHRKEIK
jgi:hypothetical protein